ncbi:hypothetical protein GHT06_020646 [Daphnia sinensis]|uniref:Uncharacterized protein n=1 Tax=Daphnia sinensis TaxID=1820382 RepID=A0AAD5PM80_9CRUS|nr:hypothetical protein GHT06_020646 [Daphnia sinensis]
MNIPLLLERPVLNVLRHFSRGIAGVSQTVKDDPYSHFALKQKAETIHHVLGFKMSKAKNLLRKDRALAQKPLAHYTKISESLGSIKPIVGQSEQSTNLFLSSPPVVQRNCKFLQECGATQATADIITSCQNFMGVPIGVFKSYANIDHAVDVQGRWLDLVSESSSWRLKNEKLLERHTTPCSSISYVRNVIFSSYVARKWKMPFPKVLKWVEEGIRTQPLSIRRLMRTISVLTKIGFDQENMWKNPSLLQSDPDSLELFVFTYKADFLGQSASQFLLEFPELTYRIDFSSIYSNVDNLTRFGVPAACIRNNLRDLLIEDPLVLQGKIRQMEPYPELGVFVHHPKFAKLFDDVDTVVLRVKTFRAIDKRQITFYACTCSAKDFSALIQQRAQLRLSDEALRYLANRTGQPSKSVKEMLRSHPQSRQLGSENMKKVMELVAARGFTKEQIFNGLHLVLYPVELVAKKLDELPSRPEMQPIETTIKEPTILQIVVYLLEEQFMFTGNGVFAKPPENVTESVDHGKTNDSPAVN